MNRLQYTLQYTSRQERKTARNLLVRARNKLARVGWIKNQEVEYGHNGKHLGYCATGAIRQARLGGTKTYTSQYRAAEIARNAIGAIIPTVWNASITSWNDHPRRTKDQVINTFDKAIAALDE